MTAAVLGELALEGFRGYVDAERAQAVGCGNHP